MVTRGLLLDVAAGRGPLGHGDPVTVDDLERAAGAAGVRPEAGDAVLVHTGWMSSARADPARYFAGEPGIDVEAAAWLAAADVALVGSDNYAVEVQPTPPEVMFPVHQLLMRDHGIPLLENVVLSELVATGAVTFLFVATPLPLVGGTAGPADAHRTHCR